MANLDLYKSTLAPWQGSVYDKFANDPNMNGKFWSQMLPYDHTQFDPNFSVQLMDYYNRSMNLGLTDQQIANGINAFAQRSSQQWGEARPLDAGSNPVAVAAESIERALALAGKDSGAFWNVAAPMLNQGQAMADQMYRYGMAKSGQEFQANEKDDSNFLDKAIGVIKAVSPIALGALIPGVGGVLMGAGSNALSKAAEQNSFDGLLKDFGLGAIGGLAGQAVNSGLGGLFGDSAATGADFFGEGTPGATVDYGSGATGAASGTGAAAGSGGTGMFDWLSDAGSWITDLFGGSGGAGAQTLDPSLLGSDAIETMWKISEAQGGIPWTEAATNLGFNSVGSMLGSIDPSWVSTGLSDPASSAAKLLKSLGAVKADGSINPSILSGLLSAGGGILSGNAATDAAETAANAQLEAARIAADAAKFKPVGVTTRFGQSNFTKDAQGNVTSAGYTMPADIKAMQDSLIGAAPGMLGQFTGSQAATAPMGTAAQRAMNLGQGYLNADPLAQAQKFYDDQQKIMATGRARDQAGALTGEFNRGTYGLATGATGMMGAANPRLEAMYNAQRQQDLQAAANATQGGMDYAKFGAGLVGTGGNMLRDMYGTQTAAYSPFATAMTGAQNIEGLGQNALDMSINIGKTASPAQAGSLLGQGMLGAAQTMQQANQYSPWGTALMNAGNAMGTYQNQTQQQQQQQQFLQALLGRSATPV